ncbi:RadC family protein [Segetibacter aerophilus]|uniref:DNA repair protein RadC n=1 Tax=Segetibacter aerophilus TaxID=670293 RepID=A0A512BER3_9BACT|nr:DNA repair protein RadC [Segetibacter aerophilus]GEO10466.1 DNA repair protein RadC [Segetibacter aerophilus]
MLQTGIKNWAIDDRPREKLALKGAESLSNSELLAILINNGTTDKSAVDLSKELLSSVENNLQRLAKLSVKEMVNLKIKGLGPVKAVTIAAALELGVRRNMADNKKEIVLSSKDIAKFLQAQLQYKMHEVFAVVFLNRANKINHYEIISEGGITGTVADPRIILKKALEHEAVSIVLCHNHPSGNLKPSRQDQELTTKIKEAAGYFDIKVMDHIIVSEEGYYSFADDGML